MPELSAMAAFLTLGPALVQPGLLPLQLGLAPTLALSCTDTLPLLFLSRRVQVCFISFIRVRVKGVGSGLGKGL